MMFLMRAFAVEVLVAIDGVLAVALGADDFIAAAGAQEAGAGVAFEIFARPLFLAVSLPLVRVVAAGTGE